MIYQLSKTVLKHYWVKKVYRSKKEYYNISLKEAIKSIKKCIKFSGSKLILEDNFYKNFEISTDEPLKGFEIHIDNYEEQNGGYIDENNIILSYNKYKFNHYNLKNIINKLYDN